MTHITVHYTKQERERNDRVDRRVYFLVGGYGVLIHNELEVLRELISLEVGRWAELVCTDLLNLQVQLSNRVSILVGY